MAYVLWTHANPSGLKRQKSIRQPRTEKRGSLIANHYLVRFIIHPSLGQLELPGGQGKDDHKQNPGHSRRIAHIAVAKGVVEQVVDEKKCRVGRAALGHDECLTEDLERADQPHDQIKKDVGRKLRYRNISEFLPDAATVQIGGFVELFADAFQTGQPDNHAAARAP